MGVKKAIALKYREGEYAPQVLATGKGARAERIIQLAKEAGIPIVQDTALIALLDESVDVGQYIPPWCWEVVARILAFLQKEEEKSEKDSSDRLKRRADIY